jgi:hypothetical protein
MKPRIRRQKRKCFETLSITHKLNPDYDAEPDVGYAVTTRE